mmetsp:Transcript_2096/g.4853  ORF Transcript_2096/g.4853 Transcript_2096/m.4853 type:complete len:146 (-) Transcript_2096:1957-2394(-)
MSSVFISRIQQHYDDVLRSPESHSFVVWLMFSSLVGFFATPTQNRERRRGRYRIAISKMKPFYPVVQFIWMAVSLPIAYRVIPSPFFPPPYFMQKFLIDTTNLCEHQLVVVTCSLLGSYWFGVLAMKLVYSIGKSIERHEDTKYY